MPRARNALAARLQEATDVVAAALVDAFGNGALDGRIQAHRVTVAR